MDVREDLLQVLKRDGPHGLEDVIRSCSSYVAAVVAAQIRGFGTEADVEELVSDVFVALWQWRDRLQTDNLRGWLSVTARNKARDWLRKQKIITTEPEDWLVVSEADVERLAEIRERNEILRRALKQLDAETRELFLRHYFYGQSTADMAEELRLKCSTIKNRLARGRKKLKDILKEGGYDLED